MSKRRPIAFDRRVKRRREIERHARYVGAAQTEDLERWLIAWTWHNWQALDQVSAIIECARRMGREDFTPAEAEAIAFEAWHTRRCWSADNLARFLGVTYAQRQALGLTTIGSVNVGKRARKELRKLRNRRAQECRRRAQGARPRAEYEANSLSATKPWEALNMSRRTWERHRNKARDASPCTSVFLPGGNELATLRRKRQPSDATRRRKQATTVLQTADMPAVDKLEAYEALPTELRLLALGLSVPETPMRRAA